MNTSKSIKRPCNLVCRRCRRYIPNVKFTDCMVDLCGSVLSCPKDHYFTGFFGNWKRYEEKEDFVNIVKSAFEDKSLKAMKKIHGMGAYFLVVSNKIPEDCDFKMEREMFND